MYRDRDAENDSPAAVVAGPIDQQSSEVADRRAEREPKAEAPVPLGVKKIARDDEHGFFRREFCVERNHRRRDGQEKDQKRGGWEQHRRSAARAVPGPSRRSSAHFPLAAPLPRLRL